MTDIKSESPEKQVNRNQDPVNDSTNI